VGLVSWRPVGERNGLGMLAKRGSVVLSFVGAVKCRLGLSMVAEKRQEAL